MNTILLPKCYPKIKKATNSTKNIYYKSLFLLCTPDKIRTCNRLIRSQVLYPVELRVLN